MRQRLLSAANYEALRKMPASFDVIVIGAGPAGSVTALRLARQGLRVALLDRSRFDTPRIGESLPPAIHPLLSDLSLWPEFEAIAPIPSFGTRSIWGGVTPEAHSHMITPYRFGWHIDRLRFDRMLVAAAERVGADLRLNTAVESCNWHDAEHCWLLHITQGSKLRASFVIDATGRSAWFSRRQRSECVAFDSLVGIAAHVDRPAAGSGSSDSCFTQVETTQHGWWYTAPIAADRFIAVLMTDADLVKPGALHTPAGWLDALRCAPFTMGRLSWPSAGGAFSPADPLGPICPVNNVPQPKVHSAVSQRLMRTDLVGQWLAVGDAALAVDPVSGSGICRALRTAEDAAKTVIKVLSGEEVDPVEAIERYEQRRNAECTEYLLERASYYGAEQRWQRHAFWARRCAMGIASAGGVVAAAPAESVPVRSGSQPLA
jgi:2-polyprenyl-6-methoxyphenol hydroxylase-like FAD-dependent oxidoreductase